MRQLLPLLVLLVIFSATTQAQTNFIHQDTIFARSNDCLLGITACIDSFQFENLNDYTYTLNNQPYAPTNINFCKRDSIYGYSFFFLKNKPAPFTLTNWIVKGVSHTLSFSKLNDLKDSMRRWTAPDTNWQVSADTFLIYQTNVSPINFPAQIILSQNGSVRDSVGLNRGVLYNGARLNVTSGISKFIVTRIADKISDTVTIAAACFSSQPKIIRNTGSVDSIYTACVDTTSFIGRVKSTENICPKVSNVIKINTVAKACVNFTAVSVGTDTVCIKVCDVLGFCDTTKIIVSVLNKFQTGAKIRLIDSVFMDSTKQRCDVLLPANGTSVIQTLSFNTPSKVVFDYNKTTHCFIFRGTSEGVDSFGLRVCNADGVCDTTILAVKVLVKTALKSQIYTYKDSIVVDSAARRCLNLPQNAIVATTFKDFCKTNNKGNVKFTLDSIRHCVFYSGIKPGVDTACIEICNDKNICDTTYFYIKTIARTADTIPVTATTHHSDTINVKINQTVSYCPDTSRLRNSPIKSIAYCELSLFDNVEIALDTARKCLKIKGVKIGIDTFCLVIKNQAGFADTTRLFVKVSTDTLRTQVRFDSIKVFISDSTNYCYTDSSFLNGSVDTLYNSCSGKNGNASQVSYSKNSRCFTIVGLFEGKDTLCIRACNFKTGLCDSILVTINVLKKDISRPTRTDSVKTNIFGTTTYCFDTISPQTTISFCSAANTKKSTRTISGKCVVFSGKSAGVDTVCVLTCRPSGVCDTTILRVFIAPDTAKAGTRIKNIFIPIGKDTLVCLDTAIIRTAVDTFFDNCNTKNGLYARISPQKISRCVQISGIKPGVDTACLVICNVGRTICDTTNIIVTVLDTAKINLKANDDFDTTRLSRNKEVLVYANDSLFNKIPTSLTITSPSKKGKASVLSITQGIIQYETTASPQECGLDSFSYKVCIGTTCSEANVVVNVLCSDTLIVFNAISPNGDGVNDVLVILGLQNYPQNTLLVFNRWGNQVLKTSNYQNDWLGTWNGKDLPDGTYFYQIYDDSKNILLKSGYIQIFR